MNTLLENSRFKINQNYLTNEAVIIQKLLDFLDNSAVQSIHHQAHQLVTAIRANKNQHSLVEAFLHEYQLNSEEGIVLMGIAEALLRIPDSHTQDLFLQEKLSEADWHKHLHQSDSLLVNFATQALDITAKIEKHFDLSDNDHQQVFSKLSARLGFPIIRTALKQAMQQLAYQFVIAETIEQASIKANQQSNYLYSFDMLGEAALTMNDADRYFNDYAKAIKYLAKDAKNQDIFLNPSISIKLSALYPRYEPFHQQQAVQQISNKLLYLSQQARNSNISVTVDAEESERLDMSLDIFTHVLSDSTLKGWGGLGLAVQAYQKRAINTLQFLADLAESKQCKIPIRLVKGAYWDSEIKRAQVNGLSDFPVFTQKSATDISYLVSVQFILSRPNCFYPQFATHNAHTVAAILEWGKNHPGYEFQRLHGMGEQLYQQILKQTQETIPCRVYAPVGHYQELLPYLVRRLLENGANTSFINLLENPDINIETVIVDPVKLLKENNQPKTQCILPKDLFAPQRINSEGFNLADPKVQTQLISSLKKLESQTWLATPLVNGITYSGSEHNICNPADKRLIVGRVIYSDKQIISDAISSANLAFNHWRLSKIQQRANFLLKAAELIEKNRIELTALCVREAGKTIKDALAEIREAVDFCRYYANLAIELFEQPLTLPGPTGEKNQLKQLGRGVFVCISPWNFPVAIFMGQIAAALVSGNTVIAKPSTQTPLIAMRCVQLLHQAGIPKNVLHLLPGEGDSIAEHLLSDSRIAGVAFTGSLKVAQSINQQLSRHACIVPLIAETGGQNVMICDSSAYSEQLIQDVVQSAFNSAGQRCSALRVLYIPYETADNIVEKLIAVMKELRMGMPQFYETDIGPLINKKAVNELTDHISKIKKPAKLLFQLKPRKQFNNACFFPPTLIELNSLSQLTKENFGPVLHVIRYNFNELDRVIDAINASGYGLTLGIHSRINKTIETIIQNSKVGNIYVNRNMIAAVVGVQPFGGMGLSGTGPKAGGPHYLQGFSTEQTVSTNTAAIGGNTSLLAGIKTECFEASIPHKADGRLDER